MGRPQEGGIPEPSGLGDAEGGRIVLGLAEIPEGPAEQGLELGEDRRGLCVFVLPAIVNDIPRVHDRIGKGVEGIYVGNGQRKVRNSPRSIRCLKIDMRIGDLRNDHAAGAIPAHAILL